VRLFAVCALLSLCVACGTHPAPAPTSSPPKPVAFHVNATRIDRARSELPQGYEVSVYSGPPAPLAVWGFDAVVAAEPPQCQTLATPAVDPATARGWSASGPGGIVYAVVAGAKPATAPEPALLAECARWTLESAHTMGAVTAQPGPAIDAAQTVALTTAATTTVEGGMQTRSQADTFVAYLGDHVCFVALVTDPGAASPSLDAGFAAHLLAAAVSAVRG
jgi:hypothetical protein